VVVVVIWGWRIAPIGRLNVKGWMYWLLKVNMNSQYCNASSGWVGRLPERETRDIATPLLSNIRSTSSILET
jgi:hypothetical protein